MGIFSGCLGIGKILTEYSSVFLEELLSKKAMAILRKVMSMMYFLNIKTFCDSIIL